MPIAYRIDARAGVVITTVSGVVRDADLLGYMESFPKDPAFERGMCGLVDATAVEGVDVAGEAIREAAEVASRNEELLAGSKLAIVAPADFAFGIARMYQSRRDQAPYEVEVFRARHDAVRWLGLENDPG